MTEIRVEPRHLGDHLVAEGERHRRAQRLACVAAAFKLVSYLKQQTDDLGITNTGVYKNSHRAQRTSDGAVAYNDAPHSGIVELGCRPHFVSREGIEALKRWAMLKLGLDEKEAEGAAWGIAHNIAKNGLVGRFVYRDAIPQAIAFYDQELERILASAGDES